MYCKSQNCIQSILPQTAMYFKEELMEEILTIPTQSVHAAHFAMYKSMFVILPEIVGDKYTCDLVRSGRVSVIPYVEGKHARQLDCRNIHRCVMLFLDVKVC